MKTKTTIASLTTLTLSVTYSCCHAFLSTKNNSIHSNPLSFPTITGRIPRTDRNLPRPLATPLRNIYDDWRSDAIIVDPLPLDEETVQMCLDELIYSNYGKTMFGVHDVPASIGITGEISLAEINGPEVYLSLSGKFWHTRTHVLGRAAMYLNARIPEIMSVSVLDPEDLNDYEQVMDECTGDVIETIDKRSVDYNGDRATMIYQGIDPDQRGPFVNYMGGDFKIIPS